MLSMIVEMTAQMTAVEIQMLLRNSGKLGTKQKNFDDATQATEASATSLAQSSLNCTTAP